MLSRDINDETAPPIFAIRSAGSVVAGLVVVARLADRVAGCAGAVCASATDATNKLVSAAALDSQRKRRCGSVERRSAGNMVSPAPAKPARMVWSQNRGPAALHPHI